MDPRRSGVRVTPPGPETQRLFVGVPIPPEGVQLARGAQQALPPVPGLRVARVDQLHVTLAFLGEVGSRAREAAREVVAGLPAGMGGVCRLGGYRFLPSPRKARVVALSVSDPQGVFAALYEAVMSGLEAGKVMHREKRPFLPHLTVARLREPAPVQPKSECGTVAFPVESVCLYRSELRRDGAVYSIVEQRHLGGC